MAIFIYGVPVVVRINFINVNSFMHGNSAKDKSPVLQTSLGGYEHSKVKVRVASATFIIIAVVW